MPDSLKLLSCIQFINITLHSRVMESNTHINMSMMSNDLFSGSENKDEHVRRATCMLTDD